MGLSLEFHSGDWLSIMKAAADGDLSRLRNKPVVTRSADFSLHLEPGDLNILSESIGKCTSQDPRPLRPFLKPLVDAKTHGALDVDREWVRYAAEVKRYQAIQSDVVSLIAETWAAAMRDHHREEIQVTDAMRTAIRELGELCHEAAEGRRSVVHVWHL